MFKKGNAQLKIFIILLVFFVAAGFVFVNNYLPSINKVLPSEVTNEAVPTNFPITDTPVVTKPKPNDKVASPLTVEGIVPIGWMFEGVFPIKLLDDDGNVIAETPAKEQIPGSWQSGEPVYFKATLTFTPRTSSGVLVLVRDNPSGNPEFEKKYEVPVNF